MAFVRLNKRHVMLCYVITVTEIILTYLNRLIISELAYSKKYKVETFSIDNV